MVNDKNQPFDAEQWLATQKKGIGGKVSRELFLAKMKELGGEIEDKRQLLEKREKEKQALEDKLKTTQTELTNRDQIIQAKDKNIEELNKLSKQSEQKIIEHKEKEEELTTKLAEQKKVLQSKEQELINLQSRPDITNQKYQELLNNQEKHKEEDLKPINLPTDWEKQLSDKKELEMKLLETQEKNKEVKKYIGELEKRPTTEQLQQAVQKEATKYKDYVKLSIQEQEAINNYSKVKNELEEANKKLTEPSNSVLTEIEYQELNQQLQTEKEKNRVLAEKLNDLPPPISINEESIINKVGEIVNSTLNPLRLEIIELKKQLTNNSTNSESPLPNDYKELRKEKEELLEILKVLNAKIT